MPKMDFSAIEKTVYGNHNLEDDPELMAELLALEEEERQSKPSVLAKASAVQPRLPPNASSNAAFGIDPSIMEKALADNVCCDDDALEDDEDLLNELNGLVDTPSSSGNDSSASNPKQGEPTRSAPPLPTANPNYSNVSQNLRELLKVYEKMKADSEKENNAHKTRRLQRSTDKLKELIAKTEKGIKIDASEIPPAPPGWQAPISSPASEPTAVSTPTALTVPAVAKPASHSSENPVRAAAHGQPANTAPPVPARKESGSLASSSVGGDSKKQQVMNLLLRRKKAFVENGKAAIAVHDKEAALEFVQMSKMFDQAIAALESASVDDLDLSEIPSTPPPYRKKIEPQTFIQHLEYRCQRYEDMVEAARKQGNDRKIRMNQRTVATYQEAIKMAKSGKPVNAAELPSLPDMAPLPPQTSQSAVAPRINQPIGPVAGVKPPPAVGPLADSGPSGVSRNATQLQFILQRQKQFKEAALAAKNRGDIELAKKYLLDAKGFDKMISASKNGLPVNIKDTPIPPQASMPASALQPKIVPTTTSATGVEGRGETLSMLEKGLIEQIQVSENNRMKFTRLGDVGKVKLFEGWAKTAKQDLLLIREVAKQGLRVPKFHIESRPIPSADLFPDLAEDVLEMTIIQCRDVPLPPGYEATHANIFIRYTFPYPTENPQTGKSKIISSTTSPEFDETVIFQIGTKKARGSKLSRVLKRAPLKLEVYQKGGFLRSDKLLGTCEWKLDDLEGKAEMEESLPLKEGRKAVGGLLSLRVRVREPLGDAKLQITTQKWIVLDA